MHVAMVIDEERLTHEHGMLRRLCIGLIDTGVKLTRIVPETIASEVAIASEERIALAPRVLIPMKVLPWQRRTRAERIAEAIGATPGRSDVPDVIYAVGRDAWTVALDLAEVLDRPAVINVWSARLLNDVRRLAGPRRAADAEQRRTAHSERGLLWKWTHRSSRHVAAFIAASTPIAHALAQRVDAHMVALVPMGTPVPPKPRKVLSRHPDSIGVAIVGKCEDLRSYAALLEGLSRVIGDERYRGIQIAIELRGPKCHEVWRLARQAGLLEFASALDDASQHRSLLTQCDIMLVPERSGELTSLMLEAMAGSMPVIARDDPFLDMIVDGDSGLLVDEDEPQQWSDRIAQLLDQPETARRIGLAGRELVRKTHSSAEQANRLGAALELVAGSGAYRFQQAVD